MHNIIPDNAKGERIKRLNELSKYHLSEIKKWEECHTQRDKEIYMQVAHALAKIQDKESGLFEKLSALNPEIIAAKQDNATCCYMKLDKGKLNMVITNIIKSGQEDILSNEYSFSDGAVPVASKEYQMDMELRNSFINSLGESLRNPQFVHVNLAKKGIKIGNCTYMTAVYTDISQRNTVDRAIDVLRQYGQNGIQTGIQELTRQILSGEFGGNKDTYQNRNARTIPIANVKDDFFQDLYITEINSKNDPKAYYNADARTWANEICSQIGAEVKTELTESKDIQKYENQTSTPHQDLQRIYMSNLVTVTDLDCFRMKDGQITEIIELKRVQEDVEYYNPNIEHYRDAATCGKGRNYKNQIMLQNLLAESIGADYYMLCNEGMHEGHNTEDMDHIKIYYGAYSNKLIGQFAFSTYGTYSAEEIAAFPDMKTLIDYDIRMAGRTTPKLVRHQTNESPIPKSYQGELQPAKTYKNGKLEYDTELRTTDKGQERITKMTPARFKTDFNLYDELDCKYKTTDFLKDIRPQNQSIEQIVEAYRNAGYPDFAIQNIVQKRISDSRINELYTWMENRPNTILNAVITGSGYFQYDNPEMGIYIPLERGVDFAELDEREYLYEKEAVKKMGYESKVVHKHTMSLSVQQQIAQTRIQFLEHIKGLSGDRRIIEWENYKQAMNYQYDNDVKTYVKYQIENERSRTNKDILPNNFIAKDEQKNIDREIDAEMSCIQAQMKILNRRTERMSAQYQPIQEQQNVNFDRNDMYH